MADLSKIVELVIQAKDEASQVLQQVSKKVERLDNQLKKSGVATKKLGAVSKKTTADTDKLGKSTQKLSRGLAAVGKKAKAGKAGLTSFDSKVKTTKGGTNDLSGAVSGLMGKFVALAAVVATFALPVIVSAKFNRSMAEVRAVVGDVSDKDFRHMIKVAREMGATTEFSAQQAAEGLKYLAMAGLNAAQSMEALPGVLNLAQAGAIGLGDAADIATNVLTGMGLKVSDLSRVNDVLVQTFTSTNSTLRELGSAMVYVAPVAAGFNISLEATAAALGLLHNAGMKGSLAGTTLRGMLTRLVAPSAKAAKIMARLGERIGQATIKTVDAQGHFIGFVKLMDQLQASGMTASEAIQMLGQRAGPGLVALMSQGAGAFKQLDTELLNAKGRASEVAKIMHDNLVGDTRAFTSAITEDAIAIGDTWTPAVRVLVQGLTWVAQLIGEAARNYPVLTTGVLSLVGAFLALAAAIMGISVAQGAFALLGVSLSGVFAQVVGIGRAFFSFGALVPEALAPAIANVVSFGMAAETTGALVVGVLGGIVASLAYIGIGVWIGHVINEFTMGSAKIKQELNKVEAAAEKTEKKLIEFANWKPKSRKEIVWFDPAEFDKYKQNLEKAFEYIAAKKRELTIKASRRTFWSHAETAEAKKAQLELVSVRKRYDELSEAINAYAAAKFSGPTGGDIGAKLAADSIDSVDKYRNSLDNAVKDQTTFEKAAKKSWNAVAKKAGASVLEQTAAISKLAVVYGDTFRAIAYSSLTEFGKVKHNYEAAIASGATKAQLVSLGASLKQAARVGAKAFLAMGTEIDSVLDRIAQKEKVLTDKIRQYSDSITRIHETAAARRLAIAQETMSASQKYASNRRASEEAFAIAASIRAQAEKVDGAERNRLLKKANSYLEKGLTLSDQLHASKKAGVSADQSRQDRLRAVNQYEKESVSNLKLMKSGAEAELATWEKLANKVKSLKTLIDGMAASMNKAIKIKLDSAGATTELEAIQSTLSGLTGKGILLDVSVAGVDKAKTKVVVLNESVKQVGDTWVNVWDKASVKASSALGGMLREVKGLNGKSFNIKITGSGSATLPISEKVKAVKKDLAGLAGKGVKINFDFGQATADIQQLDKGFASMSKQIDTSDAKVKSLVDKLNDIAHKNIKITLAFSGLDKLTKLLHSLSGLHDRVVTVTTRYISARAGGGPAYEGAWSRPASALVTAGNTSTDTVRALLQKDEYIIRGAVVRRLGVAAFDILNAGHGYIQRMATGGLVDPLKRGAAGAIALSGGVGAPQKQVRITLVDAITNKSVDLDVDPFGVEDFMHVLERKYRLRS